jgi:hypothetical protein
MADNKLIPARYIGHHAARLAQRLAFNIDGSRRQSSLLESGDTIMMPEREILGFTLLHDPHMVNDPLDLGVGKRVLPQHVNLTDEQRAALGYEHHQGRTDFEPLEVEGSIEESKPADKAPSGTAQEPAQPVQEPSPAEAPQETPPAAPDPLTVLNNLSSGG